MPIEIIALIGLAAVFVLATTLSVNMGAIAFVAAFVVGAFFASMPTEDIITEGFPSELFVTLVGVTYLFALAHNNGTVEWLTNSAVRLVRGRIVLVPWVMFAVTALLAMAGAPLVAVIAILAPVGLAFARQYSINPLLMGLMVVNGGGAGGLAPSSVLGSLSNDIAERSGLAVSPGMLFACAFGYNLVLGVVTFLLFGGMKLRHRGAVEQPDAASSPAATTKYRVLTLIGLAALAFGSLVFEVDIGVLAMTVATVLSVISPATGRVAVTQVAWPTVLLVCGTITYVNLLRSLGTIDYLGGLVAGIGIPVVGALIVCLVGALGSAFASTIGMLGALVPLTIPLLAQGELNATGVITALAISALVVDASPLSSTGALVVANSPEEQRDQIFRRLLVWGLSLIVIAPATTWLLFVVLSPQ